MAKFSRNQLKGLVKECLVEILSEGLMGDVSNFSTSNTPSGRSKRVSQRKATASRRPGTESVRFGNAVNESVSALTSDPIMSSIFSDTAQNTLQEQISAEGARGGGRPADAAAATVAESDPGDLFGDSAANWAHLAFSDKKI